MECCTYWYAHRLLCDMYCLPNVILWQALMYSVQQSWLFNCIATRLCAIVLHYVCKNLFMHVYIIVFCLTKFTLITVSEHEDVMRLGIYDKMHMHTSFIVDRYGQMWYDPSVGDTMLHAVTNISPPFIWANDKVHHPCMGPLVSDCRHLTGFHLAPPHPPKLYPPFICI